MQFLHGFRSGERINGQAAGGQIGRVGDGEVELSLKSLEKWQRSALLVSTLAPPTPVSEFSSMERFVCMFIPSFEMTFPCFSSVNHTFDSVHVNSVPTGGNHRQRPGQPHHSLLCSLHRHREAHWRSCQEPGLLKLNRSLEFGCLPLGNTKCDFNVNAIGFLNTFITNQYLASAT